MYSSLTMSLSSSYPSIRSLGLHIRNSHYLIRNYTPSYLSTHSFHSQAHSYTYPYRHYTHSRSLSSQTQTHSYIPINRLFSTLPVPHSNNNNETNHHKTLLQQSLNNNPSTTLSDFNGISYQPTQQHTLPFPNLHWNGRPRLHQRSNIVLMGPPGSGKSTVAKILSQMMSMEYIDIDDHVLEPAWGSTVASKLHELGDTEFLQEEARITQALNVKNTIISLSGSNPLVARTIEILSRHSTIIYLDISKECILDRLHVMKVDRIVGQSSQSLDEILEYRRAIYENSYDIRVVVPYKKNLDPNSNEYDYTTQEAIAEHVYDRYRHYSKQEYVSTRGYSQSSYNTPIELLDAIRLGLAADRGLYVASVFQPFHLGQLERLLPLSYPEVALRVLGKSNTVQYSTVLYMYIMLCCFWCISSTMNAKQCTYSFDRDSNTQTLPFISFVFSSYRTIPTWIITSIYVT
jgi:shikimate kinase